MAANMITKEVESTVRQQLVDFIVQKHYNDIQTGLSNIPDTFHSAEHYREVLTPHVWEQLKRSVNSKHVDPECLKRSIKDGCVEIAFDAVSYGAELAIVEIRGELGVLTKVNNTTSRFKLNFSRSMADGHVQIKFVNTLSEAFKILCALQVVGSISMHIDTILGQVPAYEVHDEMICELAVRHELVHAQAIAVSRFVCATSGIQMLQGPPGTGKTHTIVAIIKEILGQGDRKIVVCTPANSGLESLADKLEKHTVDFDILARREKICPRHHSKIVRSVTKRIVLCTLAQCMKLARGVQGVDVIVDEAGQATDPTTLLAFLLRPVRCLLVGDTKQLLPHVESPPSDHSDAHSDENFGRSMMERLEAVLSKQLELSVHSLDESFRGTPEMLSFSNEQFYHGKLRSNVSRSLLSREGFALSSYFLVDVKDGYSVDSYVNRKEAKSVIQCAELFLTRPGILPSDIVVLCDYKAQKEHIQTELLKKRLDICVMTVDSSQGNEYRIVLASFARTKHYAGFLKNPNRLNVKLTRAMECLVLFGNARALVRMGENKKGERNIIGLLMDDLKRRSLVRSLEQCFVLPDVHQILAGVAQNELLNYFDIIRVPFETTLRIKKAEAASLSSTIKEDLLRRAASSLGIIDPSAEQLVLLKFFVARKFHLVGRIDQLEVLYTLAQFHLLDSEDEYYAFLEQFERYSVNCEYPEPVRFLAKTTALWIRYRILALAGEDFRSLLSDYAELDCLCRGAQVHSTKHLLQWGLVLLRLGERALAAEKFKQVCMAALNPTTAMNVVHALNFDDIYSAICLWGEIIHKDLPVPCTKKAKQMLIKHFEQANQLSSELSMPRSWGYEMLAGYYMDCGDHLAANYTARQALYRHSGNIHAYRVLIDSKDL